MTTSHDSGELRLLTDKVLELGRNQEEIGRQVVALGGRVERILDHQAEQGASLHQLARGMNVVGDRIGCVEDRLSEGSSRFSEVLGRISSLERTSRNGLTKRRILLVEDDEPLARVTHRNLEECGAYVTSVARYDAALDVVRVCKPGFGCAIVDVQLPDGNGTDLARTLRARGMLVVLCSGDIAELERAALLGHVDATWQKPLRIEVMRASLMALFSASEHSADTERPGPDYSTDFDRESPTKPGSRLALNTPPPPTTADESPEAKKRGE